MQTTNTQKLQIRLAAKCLTTTQLKKLEVAAKKDHNTILSYMARCAAADPDRCYSGNGYAMITCWEIYTNNLHIDRPASLEEYVG